MRYAAQVATRDLEDYLVEAIYQENRRLAENVTQEDYERIHRICQPKPRAGTLKDLINKTAPKQK